MGTLTRIVAILLVWLEATSVIAAQSLRVLVITLEYGAMFSGNGVASQSLAQALARNGDLLTVVCAVPTQELARVISLSDEGGAVAVRPYVVNGTWGFLDERAPWQEFARAVADDPPRVDAHVLLCVDWHCAAVRDALPAPVPRSLFLLFRAFGRAPGAAQRFLLERERAAAIHSDAGVALSRNDADYLSDMLPRGVVASVVAPPLRGDLRLHAATVALDASAQATALPRRYIVCCVRLVEAKGAMLFARAMEILARRGPLPVRPLLCADSASADACYAAEVKRRLLAAVPDALIQEGFSDASTLARMWARSKLNVHPPSCVRLLALGAPTLRRGGGPCLILSRARPQLRRLRNDRSRGSCLWRSHRRRGRGRGGGSRPPPGHPERGIRV